MSNTYQPLFDIWNAGIIQTIDRPTVGGTVDNIHLITTDKGRYALRATAHNNPQRLIQEHELIIWAYQHNIPTPSGETIIQHNNKHYALFPFVSGIQVTHGNLEPSQIAAMGRFLAQIYTIRRRHPRRPQKGAKRPRPSHHQNQWPPVTRCHRSTRASSFEKPRIYTVDNASSIHDHRPLATQRIIRTTLNVFLNFNL